MAGSGQVQVLASELAVVIKAPKRNVGASLAALRCGIVHVRGQVNLRMQVYTGKCRQNRGWRVQSAATR